MVSYFQLQVKMLTQVLSTNVLATHVEHRESKMQQAVGFDVDTFVRASELQRSVEPTLGSVCASPFVLCCSVGGFGVLEAHTRTHCHINANRQSGQHLVVPLFVWLQGLVLQHAPHLQPTGDGLVWLPEQHSALRNTIQSPQYINVGKVAVRQHLITPRQLVA